MHKKYEGNIQPSWPTKFGYKFFFGAQDQSGQSQGNKMSPFSPLG